VSRERDGERERKSGAKGKCGLHAESQQGDAALTALAASRQSTVQKASLFAIVELSANPLSRLLYQS
jgi:hypothetical protein